MRDILHIGRIGAPHGLHGEIKVNPWTDNNDRFRDLKDCLIVSDDEKIRTPATVEGVRFLNKQIVLKIRGYDDRTAAESLKNKLLSVKRENAIKLPADTWFIADLTGCEVIDEKHGLLGILTDVIQNSAHDVYVVRQKGFNDILIPVLKSIVMNVDLDQRKIDVSMPEGLFEIYRGQP
jgi:16S rRNA processing protein RimM